MRVVKAAAGYSAGDRCHSFGRGAADAAGKGLVPVRVWKITRSASSRTSKQQSVERENDIWLRYLAVRSDTCDLDAQHHRLNPFKTSF